MNSSASMMNETRTANDSIAVKNSIHFSQVSQQFNLQPNNTTKNISDEFTL